MKTLKEFGAVRGPGRSRWLPARWSDQLGPHPATRTRFWPKAEIEVKVLTIDPETKKISLGMRQLSSNPWANAEGKYARGRNVTGRVTRVEPFGAFIELEPGSKGWSTSANSITSGSSEWKMS